MWAERKSCIIVCKTASHCPRCPLRNFFPDIIGPDQEKDLIHCRSKRHMPGMLTKEIHCYSLATPRLTIAWDFVIIHEWGSISMMESPIKIKPGPSEALTLSSRWRLLPFSPAPLRASLPTAVPAICLLLTCSVGVNPRYLSTPGKHHLPMVRR